MVIKKKIEHVIDKGGSIKQEQDEVVTITLKIPKSLLKSVDASTNKKMGVHRNGWILDAINRKLNYPGMNL